MRHVCSRVLISVARQRHGHDRFHNTANRRPPGAGGAALVMASPQKPGSGGGDWLGFFWRVGSRAAKKTMTRLREEYVAGREGRPEPAQTQRRAPGPHPAGRAWWQVLEVPRGATLREVVAAYRERIQKNHPDKVAHLSAQIRRVAEEETRRLNAAYEEARRLLGGGGKAG